MVYRGWMWMLSPEQLYGLAEVLPAGYPKSGGLVILTGDKKSGAKKGRKRSAKKVVWTPWYKR